MLTNPIQNRKSPGSNIRELRKFRMAMSEKEPHSHSKWQKLSQGKRLGICGPPGRTEIDEGYSEVYFPTQFSWREVSHNQSWTHWNNLPCWPVQLWSYTSACFCRATNCQRNDIKCLRLDWSSHYNCLQLFPNLGFSKQRAGEGGNDSLPFLNLKQTTMWWPSSTQETKSEVNLASVTLGKLPGNWSCFGPSCNFNLSFSLL